MSDVCFVFPSTAEKDANKIIDKYLAPAKLSLYKGIEVMEARMKVKYGAEPQMLSP